MPDPVRRLPIDDPRRADLPLAGPGPYRVTDGKVWTETCEIDVVDHCNLRCQACSHLSPVAPRHAVDPDDIARDLVGLAPIYHAHMVKLIGGEPLLHPDLVGVAAAVRASGICDVIRVCTNGTLLARMPAEFWEAIDEVHVSSYPSAVMTESQLAAARQAAQAAGVQLTVAAVERFRHSYSERPSDDDALVDQVYRTCRVAHCWRCHTLRDGSLFRCPQSYFLPSIVGLAPADRFDVGGSLAQLVDFLEDQRPLTACRACLGTVGRHFPHIQVRTSLWRRAQDLDYRELVDPSLLAEPDADFVAVLGR